MRRWLIRGVFVVAVVALPFQLAIREIKSEPYPGLYQPSFGGAVSAGPAYETVDPRITVTDADQTTYQIAYQDLLPPTRVIGSAVFRSAFHDDQRSQDPRTASWLRQRLLVLEPERDPAEVVIEWVEVERRVDSAATRDVEVEQRVAIDVGERS